MNKNYYLEELTKKVESLEKRLKLIEVILLDKPNSTVIRPMTDDEKQRGKEKSIANGRR